MGNTAETTASGNFPEVADGRSCAPDVVAKRAEQLIYRLRVDVEPDARAGDGEMARWSP
jgi:hypothetical protein